MATTFTILNLIFATAIFTTIVGLLAFAIATQSRPDGLQTVARRREINRRRARVERTVTVHPERRRVQHGHGHGLA